MTFESEIITEDVQRDIVPPGSYRKSNGQIVAIIDMPTPYLKNAHGKLLATEPFRIAELAEMTAEIAKRDEAYASQEQST